MNPPHSESKRARILQAALELFSTRGYHGTSMQQLAAAAGVSKGLLFHHFTDKARLLEALLADLQQRLGPVPAVESASPREAYELMIHQIFQHLTAAPELAKLLVPLAIHIADTPAFHELMTQKMHGIQSYVTDLLRAMGVPEPESEAQQLALTLDGLQLRMAVDPERAPVNEIKSALLAKYL